MTALRASRCTATSQRSGQRCKRMASLGATVCAMHGGAAPQVRAAAQRRVALAEALATSERRSPAEILADCMHTADVVARQLQAWLDAGERLTPEVVDRLTEAIKLSASMARVVVDASGSPDGWEARELLARQGRTLAEISREFSRLLGHDPTAPSVVAAFHKAVQSVTGARMPAQPATVDAAPLAPSRLPAVQLALPGSTGGVNGSGGRS